MGTPKRTELVGLSQIEKTRQEPEDLKSLGGSEDESKKTHEALDTVFENQNVTIIVQNKDPYDTFSVPELAKKLGVKEKTIRNLLLRSRRLSYVPFGKGELRILRKDYEDLLDRKRVPSVDEFSPVAKKARTP